MVEDRHPSHTHFHWTCSKFPFPIPNLLLVQYMSKLASQEDPRLIIRTLRTPPIDHFPSVDFSSFPCYEIPASARFFLLQLVFSWKKIISKGNWLDTMLCCITFSEKESAAEISQFTLLSDRHITTPSSWSQTWAIAYVRFQALKNRDWNIRKVESFRSFVYHKRSVSTRSKIYNKKSGVPRCVCAS